LASLVLGVAACGLPACAAGTTFGDFDSGGDGDGGGIDARVTPGGREGGKGHQDARPESAPIDSGAHDSGADVGSPAKDSAPEGATDAPAVCIIGGSTYPSGATNAADTCQTCDPAKSTAAWTSLAEGTSCGTGEVCHATACDPGCFVSGTYYASGAANPMNACQSCQPATSTTAWTNVTDETTCAGGSCCSGTCDDEATSPSHCGVCGSVCPSVADGTADCVSRVCGIVCNPGYVLSGSTCVVVSTACPVTFPDTTSTTGGTDSSGTLGVGGTSEYRWHAGDYVDSTFTCSNATITQLSVSFQMSDSTDSYCTGTLSWNVMVNGTVVGTYSWFGGLGPGTQTITQAYTFAPIAATAGSYTIEYIATSTVCPGGGNWDWIPGGSATMN
jgi:hypothetical protein